MATTSPRRSEEPPRPSPLACTTCRRKHVKCDAKQPMCSRCAGSGLQCNYTPSRRGYRGPRSQEPETGQGGLPLPLPLGSNRGLLSRQPTPPADEISSRFSSVIPTEDFGHACGSNETRMSNSFDTSQNLPQPALSPESHESTSAVLLSSPSETVLPESKLPELSKASNTFIGSHYTSVTSSEPFRSIAAKGLGDSTEKTSCMVQARLLFAIALHGRNEIKEAQAMLARAVSIALEIGMNLRDFASNHGGQEAIEQESLRRTWWELYIVDSIMAGFWRKSEFSIHSFTADVLLPCEETTYMNAACMANPPTVAQFDNRLFADDEVQFSSFCYRIEAARILTRVLALGAREVNQDQVQAVDNALAGWTHHLPPSKVDIINTFGEVDEILFQAHMMIQYASIFLHFPRSNLLSTPAAQADIAGGQRDIHISPTSTQHTHATKATEASKQLSNLAALRLPVQNHTPFFICGLVLGAIVQLSACSAHAGKCLEQHRDRVALIIGVLKSLSRTWTFSQIVLQQIKKVAAEVFHVGEISSNRPAPVAPNESGVDISVGEDNFWLDNLDIQALQNMMPFDIEMVYAEPS